MLKPQSGDTKHIQELERAGNFEEVNNSQIKIFILFLRKYFV